MRWRRKRKPEVGEVRVVRRFLWFPKCIGEEWRWLEWAVIRQRYAKYRVHAPGNPKDSWIVQRWDDVEWIDAA